MYSVGIDMVEISRIKKSMENPRFLKFILGEKEYEQLKNKNFISQSVATNFCAKEAFAKAVGTGFRGFNIKEVQVLRNELGRPYIFLTGKAFEMWGKNGYGFSVSLTHTKKLASAVVVCFKDESVKE